MCRLPPAFPGAPDQAFFLVTWLSTTISKASSFPRTDTGVINRMYPKYLDLKVTLEEGTGLSTLVYPLCGVEGKEGRGEKITPSQEATKADTEGRMHC